MDLLTSEAKTSTSLAKPALWTHHLIAFCYVSTATPTPVKLSHMGLQQLQVPQHYGV